MNKLKPNSTKNSKAKLKGPKVMLIIGLVIGLAIAFFAVRAIHLFLSVGKFTSYWQSQNGLPRDESKLTLVALGDSTVQAVGASNPRQGFVGQLSNNLSQSLNKPVQIYNFSKSGATVDDVIDRQLKEALAIKNPGLIIIAIGPNDLIQGKSLPDYLAKYQRVLEQLPKQKIVIASLPPLGRRSVAPEKLREWNDALKQLASSQQIQQAKIFETISANEDNQLIYAGDFFHPSNRGYKLWAEAFTEPALKILNNKK